MAYDKMVDSAVLDGDLTSVADAIRSKGGTSAPLEFPTGFVDAISKIATGGGGAVAMEEYDITIASDLGQPAGENSIPTLLTANAFVKANYAKDGFAVVWYPKTAIAGGSNIAHGIYHGNANIGATSAIRYGFLFLSTSASAVGTAMMTTKVSGNSYNVSFRAKSNGNLDMYVGNTRTVKAGNYKLILICAEV